MSLMIIILGITFLSINIGTMIMPRKVVYIHDQPIRKAQQDFWGEQ